MAVCAFVYGHGSGDSGHAPQIAAAQPARPSQERTAALEPHVTKTTTFHTREAVPPAAPAPQAAPRTERPATGLLVGIDSIIPTQLRDVDLRTPAQRAEGALNAVEDAAPTDAPPTKTLAATTPVAAIAAIQSSDPTPRTTRIAQLVCPSPGGGPMRIQFSAAIWYSAIDYSRAIAAHAERWTGHRNMVVAFDNTAKPTAPTPAGLRQLAFDRATRRVADPSATSAAVWASFADKDIAGVDPTTCSLQIVAGN